LLARHQPGVPWRGDLLDDAARLGPLDARVQLAGRAKVAVEQMEVRSAQPDSLDTDDRLVRLGEHWVGTGDESDLAGFAGKQGAHGRPPDRDRRCAP
jgi:hypothetical protein